MKLVSHSFQQLRQNKPGRLLKVSFLFFFLIPIVEKLFWVFLIKFKLIKYSGGPTAPSFITIGSWLCEGGILSEDDEKIEKQKITFQWNNGLSESRFQNFWDWQMRVLKLIFTYNHWINSLQNFSREIWMRDYVRNSYHFGSDFKTRPSIGFHTTDSVLRSP